MEHRSSGAHFPCRCKLAAAAAEEDDHKREGVDDGAAGGGDAAAEPVELECRSGGTADAHAKRLLLPPFRCCQLLRPSGHERGTEQGFGAILPHGRAAPARRGRPYRDRLQR